jgi:DnaJ like chaperone protein
MSWLGKMIGGTIGFALGGPIGAVAGATFGHTFVDRKEDAYLKSIPGGSIPGRQMGLSTNEEAQLIFFTAAFSMLAKICKADGQISEKEIEAVEAFMTRDLQLDHEGRETAKQIFRRAIDSPEGFEAFAQQFYAVFRAQPNIIELMVDVLLRVSAADGQISNEEESMLLSVTRIFNVSDTNYSRLKSKYVRVTNKYYAVLKCDESASNEELKKQYRTLVTEYHPDKIEAKGLPEEFIKFANDKFREIQEAYEHIKQERGL